MTGVEQAAPRRASRRGFVVLAIVLLALIAFGSTTQTWLMVRLPQEAVQTPDLEIAGSDAAVPVTAFALVALAAALAVSIAGRVARWVVAVVLVLAGAGIAVSSTSVALDPRAAAEPAIGTAIGVSGSSGAVVSATALPVVAAVAGVLLVLAAGWVVLAGRGWTVDKRYDAGAARVPRPTGAGVPSGDAATSPPSTGDIPPGLSDDPVRPAGPEATGPGNRNAHADEIDSWDQLSRGNDPTR